MSDHRAQTKIESACKLQGSAVVLRAARGACRLHCVERDTCVAAVATLHRSPVACDGLLIWWCCEAAEGVHIVVQSADRRRARPRVRGRRGRRRGGRRGGVALSRGTRGPIMCVLTYLTQTQSESRRQCSPVQRVHTHTTHNKPDPSQ